MHLIYVLCDSIMGRRKKKPNSKKFQQENRFFFVLFGDQRVLNGGVFMYYRLLDKLEQEVALALLGVIL